MILWVSRKKEQTRILTSHNSPTPHHRQQKEKDTMSAHADAMNLARRLSARAENDLLQTNLYDDDTKSLQYCQDVATKIANVKDLPASCKKYPEVLQTLQRRTTTKDDATIAFQGMRPGSAAQARSARAKGKEHHAQIQRRYTRTETRKAKQ